MWAAPLALGCLLHVRVQADHVISPGAGVAQNDLAALLAHLTVVLVVRLVTVRILGFVEKRKLPSVVFVFVFFVSAQSHHFLARTS